MPSYPQNTLSIRLLTQASGVFADIPYLRMSLLSFLLINGLHAYASQDAVQSNASPSQVPALSEQKSTILRLEDTIRGNKEQPQVLTIVPWQLPIHQRINENAEWRLQVTELPSIERNAFLRNLAVVKEMKAENGSNAAAKETQQDNY